MRMMAGVLGVVLAAGSGCSSTIERVDLDERMNRGTLESLAVEVRGERIEPVAVLRRGELSYDVVIEMELPAPPERWRDDEWIAPRFNSWTAERVAQDGTRFIRVRDGAGAAVGVSERVHRWRMPRDMTVYRSTFAVWRRPAECPAMERVRFAAPIVTERPLGARVSVRVFVEGGKLGEERLKRLADWGPVERVLEVSEAGER